MTTYHRKPTGWEYDIKHRPHPMSEPCTICDDLPVRRDVDAIIARKARR